MAKKKVRNVLPKIAGGDVELGNSITGGSQPVQTTNTRTVQIGNGHGSYSYSGSGHEASRVLLRYIDGFKKKSSGSAGSRASTGYSGGYQGANYGYDDDYGGFSGNSGSYGVQDFGRKYLPANGGCAYIDMSHLELCLPEVLSAKDHVAAWHAMLRIARKAQIGAQETLDDGQKINVMVNNSDGNGNSYGSHLNMLVTRECHDDLMKRKMHYMLFLASHQVSSIIYTGAGKVGSENNRPDCDFQLAQRADFFEEMLASQTTHARPIINTRDETLAASKQARLHCIFFDNSMCHGTHFLKVGTMQVILAMIEAGYATTDLILDDPLEAILAWSHDTTLKTTARTIGGKDWTAVQLQREIHKLASGFVKAGGCDGIVPHVDEIMNMWADTLDKLEAHDWDNLQGRLDWVLKKRLIEHGLSKSESGWDSAEAKHLDHVYSSLDPEDGLFMAMDNAGVVERIVSDEEIDRFVHNPPEDTRAWFRSEIMKKFPENVEDVDWKTIDVEDSEKEDWTIDISDVTWWTKKNAESILDSKTIDEVISKISESLVKKKTYGSQTYRYGAGGWGSSSSGSSWGNHSANCVCWQCQNKSESEREEVDEDVYTPRIRGLLRQARKAQVSNDIDGAIKLLKDAKRACKRLGKKRRKSAAEPIDQQIKMLEKDIGGPKQDDDETKVDLVGLGSFNVCTACDYIWMSESGNLEECPCCKNDVCYETETLDVRERELWEKAREIDGFL